MDNWTNSQAVIVQLPLWVEQILPKHKRHFDCIEEQMALVIELSKQNLINQTGGPFAAAIFDRQGLLVSVGINLVTSMNCSVLHAEIVAIMLAQAKLERYDLSDGGQLEYVLVASTEPCAMCFGAVPWSGIKHLVCGARDADARKVGFDEGPKLENWIGALNLRGIRVKTDVLRDQAAEVLTGYASAGGRIYNAGLACHEK